jgi:hypothetical protein
MTNTISGGLSVLLYISNLVGLDLGGEGHDADGLRYFHSRRHPCHRAVSQVVEKSGCGAFQFTQIAARESGCQDWQEPNSKLRSKNRSQKPLAFSRQGDLGIGSNGLVRGENTEH